MIIISEIKQDMPGSSYAIMNITIKVSDADIYLLQRSKECRASVMESVLKDAGIDIEHENKGD